MWLITNLIDSASKISWAINQTKKTPTKTVGISKPKVQEIDFSKQSFKDPYESMNNPKSDYYTNPKISGTQISWLESLDAFKKTSIFWKEKVDWDSALQNQEIRNTIKYSTWDVYKKYESDLWMFWNAKKEKSNMIALDTEIANQRAFLKNQDPLSWLEKTILGIPFVGHLIAEWYDNISGKSDLNVRDLARNTTLAEWTTKRDWESSIVAGWLNLATWFGIYSKAEKIIGTWIGMLSKISPTAKLIDKARITSPKLFALTTSSLSEFAEYGFKKSTWDANTTKWDLLAWLTLGWGFSAAFGWTAAKSIKDTITARDLKNIEEVFSKQEIPLRNADEAFEAIKDVKLDNGFTVGEAGDVIAENGKKLLGKKKWWTITADDVLISTQGWTNGASINNATANMVADVMNQAKKDIDNAPSNWLFSKWTDDDATAIMTELATVFWKKWEVYTTDSATDVINWIVSTYWKKYTVNPDKNYEIDDLMHDILSQWNGKKLANIKTIDDIYALAWRKSTDIKIDDINNIQKSIDEYDIIKSSTKKWGKVKIDNSKQGAIVKQIEELSEKANYKVDTNKLFNKDRSLNVDNLKKMVDDIETHSFTNSTRFKNKVTQAEDLLVSTTKWYSKKISTKWVSNIKAWIRKVSESIDNTINGAKDTIKIIAWDNSSYLNQSSGWKSIARGIMNEMTSKLAWAKSASEAKKVIHNTVKKMYVKEAQFLKRQIEKEFAWVVWDAGKNANIWSYHWEALNTFIKAFNWFKWDNDVEILRDALDEVRSIRYSWRVAVKEFAEGRKKDIKDTVSLIRSDVEDTRIEFDYEENKIAVDDTNFLQSLVRWWKSWDYASRTMSDLFGWANSTWYKTFYTDFVQAQSWFMKERDKLEKTYRDLLYKAFGWNDVESSKYRVFALYRRISKEFSPERARSFLQDSSNLRLDSKWNLVVFWKNSTIPEWVFQLKDSDIDKIVNDMSKKIKINWSNIQKYDNFLQSTQKGLWTRLEDLFRKEYNVNFWQVEDYTKIKYIDWKQEWIDDSMDAMKIFTNPLAQLWKWFSKTTTLRTWDYAIDFDEDNVFQSILNDQLRFIHLKEPLSKATRTLNALASWKIDDWTNQIDGDGFDELFKSLWFWDTNRAEVDMISQDSYKYVKDYLTLVANNWSGRSTTTDRRISKFIYAKYLTFNPNSIISQFGSLTQMIHYNAGTTTYAVANLRYADNFHFAGEVSGYLSGRRSSVLYNEFEEDRLAMESASWLKKKALGAKWVMNSLWDAWKRTVVDKSYTKLDFAMELWLSPMKLTDWGISTIAWIQWVKEWGNQNNIKMGKFTNLRKMFDTLSDEQKLAARTFADNHMNKIMGATDVVAGKDFKGAMMRSQIILGKTTYNALRQTYQVIWDQKSWLGKVGKIAQALILNFMVNMWLESWKAELAYRSGLRSTNDLFPWFLTTIVKRLNGWEIDPWLAQILDYTSRWLMALVPATWVSVNEVFGITDSAVSKIESASKVSQDRYIEELINTITKVATPSNWAHTIVSNLIYEARHWKSVIEVQDENYNLSKMKINAWDMSEENITKAVELNKDIRSSKKEADSIDWIPKTQYKENLYKEMYDKFNWHVPTTKEYIDYIKTDKTKFEKLWLLWDAKANKAFHNDMRIFFARSSWEVDSILSGADMEYIFDKRLKPLIDKWDTAWYKSEVNRFIEIGVIKSKDWYNDFIKKQVKAGKLH